MSVSQTETETRDYSKLEQSESDIGLDLSILLLFSGDEIKQARQVVMRERKLSEQEVTTALLVTEVLHMNPRAL